MQTFDVIGEEFKAKWNPKKCESRKLAKVYKSLGYTKKSKNVYGCGNHLYFGVTDTGEQHLSSCIFCKDMLCPLCQWRKEQKLYHQTINCVSKLQSDGYRFLFVTLTIQNVENTVDSLKSAINTIYSSYAKLIRTKKVKNAVLGAFRAFEVTYDGNEFITPYMYNRRKKHYEKLGLNICDKNPNYDKLHPHIHLIWVVSNDYFNSDSYISQKELCEMWKNALDVDYVPVCDIRRVTAKRDKSRKTVDLSYAVAEVCKYTVKSNDYLSYSADVNKKVVKTLVNALSNRRLVNYYGVFADVRKMINDDEDDLIHVADECKQSQYVCVVHYKFYARKKGYIVEEVLYTNSDCCVGVLDG